MTNWEDKLKSMEVRFDQEEFVVIDNGTGYIKAGFSGQDLPRIVIPTVIGEYIEEIDPSQNVGGMDAQTEKKILYKYGNGAYLNKDKYSSDLFENNKKGSSINQVENKDDNLHQIPLNKQSFVTSNLFSTNDKRILLTLFKNVIWNYTLDNDKLNDQFLSKTALE